MAKHPKTEWEGFTLQIEVVLQQKIRAWRSSSNKLHRMDGPALEWSDGSKEWFREGMRHRFDGPASEHVFEAPDAIEWYYDDSTVAPTRDAYLRMAFMAEEMQSHPSFRHR